MSAVVSNASNAVASRAEWLVARRELLAQEKEFTRARDALSARRRELPKVKVDKDYIFEGPDGPVSLSELFAGLRQLIVYHFMFDPEWDEGCPSCSYLADSFTGAILHLPARDTSFVVVSRAPAEKIESFKNRMGWSFPWLSSGGTDFNYNFHVTLDGTPASTEYNFEPAADLVARGQTWLRGELPGLSVFLREGGEIFHTYSTYGRGLDLLIGTYNYLDLTPLGRGADDQDPHTMWWVRHHDRYPSG